MGTKPRAQDDEQDVEGHGQLRGPEGVKARGPEATGPIDGRAQAAGGGGDISGAESEDDTEGHQFLPNQMLSSNAAASREREIQRNLQKREVQGEARRPFFRKRKSG